MRVHLIGVSGTGMGSLAMLFRQAGHDVSGSDISFDPPMGPALSSADVTLLRGYDAAHLASPHDGAAPIDLVVVGNAIRRDNVEAVETERRGLARTSMSAALRDHFLAARRPVVVAGTHGKTTTSSLCAWLLSAAGLEPGYFIGGLPKNFESGAALGAPQRRLTAASRTPFVIEGDEYDAVYWHKEPKFFDYAGAAEDEVAVLTSIEHDHIDIYPSVEAYVAAFFGFVGRLGKEAKLIAHAADPTVVQVAKAARGGVSFYGIQGDPRGEVEPEWLAAPGAIDPLGRQEFDLYAGGVACGRFALAVPGEHNLRNAVAAIAVAAECFGVNMATLRRALPSFAGVRRRQDLLGTPGGVSVYDDFAHHPTAVDETLRALRRRHPSGKLFAVFEPRSATACRNVHQAAYAGAFGAADRVFLAPLGRTNIPPGEALDREALAKAVGTKASVAASIDAVLEGLTAETEPGDTVALLSNGAFGALPARLVTALTERDRT
jgi:UDP-N-acetylmuramate: L-alanyl-gamma-D-glutamyl-meso-diaminopimelate ligase